MSFYEVAVEHRFPVAADRVYNLIVDMDEHRRILPKEFEKLEVLEGGKGEGTVFRLTMNVMGSRPGWPDGWNASPCLRRSGQSTSGN
ncbi:MAG: hypothetical protein BAA02_03745 [Paenibacillaceae bacterium ZCTH02-B3]|nr:MAG: hypothetical protein BAA02_03745 [Paenibacillaceae bacterium ZCTH02-B3]